MNKKIDPVTVLKFQCGKVGQFFTLKVNVTDGPDKIVTGVASLLARGMCTQCGIKMMDEIGKRRFGIEVEALNTEKLGGKNNEA